MIETNNHQIIKYHFNYSKTSTELNLHVNGISVGYMYFYNDINHMTGEQFIKVSMLYINKEYRGNGYSRKLIEYFLEHVKDVLLPIKLIAEPLLNDIQLTQNQLRKFYKRLGFKQSLTHRYLLIYENKTNQGR